MSAIVKRDLEKKHLPELFSLPSGGNTTTFYLLFLLLGGGSAVFCGWISVAVGVALICWQGIDPPKIDQDKLSHEEEYVWNLLSDSHPSTGESLDAIMRDCLGKAGGNRSIPAQIMAEIVQQAAWDSGNGAYGIEFAGEYLHITTYAERRFCQLFSESTGRNLKPVNPLPALPQPQPRIPVQRQVTPPSLAPQVETEEDAEDLWEDGETEEPLPTPKPAKPTIGLDTQLRAVDVPSISVVNINDVDHVFADKGTDIVDVINSQGNSLVFMGGQGVGKSRLMAIASQIGKQQGRYKTITVCSGLAKQDEDPQYWHHCDHRLFYDLASMDDRTAEAHLQKQLQAILQWRHESTPSPKLLILDEIAYLAEIIGKPKEGTTQFQLSLEIVRILQAVASGGAKRGWHVWVGTPQGAIGSMGSIGTRIKRLQLVLCGISPMSSVISRGMETRWDAELFASAKINWQSLTYPDPRVSDRIVFFSGQWRQQTRYDLQPPTLQEPPKKTPELPKAVAPGIDIDHATQQLIGLVDRGLDRFGTLSVSNLQASASKLTGKGVDKAKLGKFLIAVVQRFPDRYFLVEGASEVTIARKESASLPAGAVPAVKVFPPVMAIRS